MQYRLILGDCLEMLKTLPDCSIDAIVTDPPAGIAFMGKGWDKDKGGKAAWKAWMQEVAAECLRVIKPGGHALVWAIPRTSHWTGDAWEDAGWQPRDKIYHAFGSGFPKSLNVGKAIDKAAGAERKVVGVQKLTGTARGHSIAARTTAAESYEVLRTERNITAPATPEAAQWEGWGTALKPAVEEWWLFRKPIEGTVASNVLEHGTGALNIDGCRVEGIPPSVPQPSLGVKRAEAYNFATGTGRNGEMSNATQGRFPANLILSYNEDEYRLRETVDAQQLKELSEWLCANT